MKAAVALLAFLAVVDASPWSKRQSAKLLTDPTVYTRSWGQISLYADNPENYFGVSDVGVPDGCQIEQAHVLQRHAQRFPTASFDDGTNDMNFAAKVMNWTAANSTQKFTGSLTFLNTYQYVMGASFLTGIGAATEFQAGVTFWNRYGRTLYNASAQQLAYNMTNPDGSMKPKVVLRTTGQSRIENSQVNWALGFFGDSFQEVPDASLKNYTQPYDVVIIPEGGTENNTLASCKLTVKLANSTTDMIVQTTAALQTTSVTRWISATSSSCSTRPSI